MVAAQAHLKRSSEGSTKHARCAELASNDVNSLGIVLNEPLVREPFLSRRGPINAHQRELMAMQQLVEIHETRLLVL
jgi:hypothetical protein